LFKDLGIANPFVVFISKEGNVVIFFENIGWLTGEWFWIVFFSTVSGLLWQIVKELKGIHSQLEVIIKLQSPHIFDKD
jgi:hypothetical protein